MNNSPALSMRRNPTITKAGFLVLSFLILSFAYELPLVNLTGKDRLNPRLFDVAAFVLIIYWLAAGQAKGWRVKTNHPIVKLWLWITVAFGFATLASIAWIPLDIYLFCIFYFLKYLLCLFVVLIFSSIPFDVDNKRKLCWVIMLGGLFTSIVAMLQFFGILGTKRFLPGGEEIVMSSHGIYSTLGVTYWHLGMYSLICIVIAVLLFFTEKSVFKKAVLLVLASMFTFSIVVCGSRAAIVALMFVAVLLIFQKGLKNIVLGAIIVGIGFSVGQYFYDTSGTKARVEQTTGNTAEARIWTGPITLLRAYDYHGPKLLLIGGGFYVVPWETKYGELKYRKGYGNHNIYLFVLEQAGVVPFVLALLMWYRLVKILRRFSKERRLPEFSRRLAKSVLAYLIAMLMVGVGGQVFWFGFGTENLTVFQVIMFIFATTVPIDMVSKSRRRPQPQQEPQTQPLPQPQ